ncbi:DUF4254 domain-containing protein [Nocardia colli]|uniref:DUF4254 domain-containing protein n=1 Tax=Nocardia colli TaxID=2545717 RepID=A0A5N0EDA9_9NOCA|nr:DUF4254 domain-containing protein [Nocardia colli]KAA8886194.1 DUF4254 domain-containing protein [Nocardia colli]
MTIITSPDLVVEQARRDVMVAEAAPNQRSLPDWHRLSAAFRGEIGWSPGDHLITRWASDFANLHRERRVNPKRAVEIDCRRTQIIHLIDDWTEKYVDTGRGKGSPRRSVGAAVDAMAAAYIAAECCLMAAENASDDTVHAAWVRVAGLACSWNDLVAQNPGPWRPSRQE